MNCIPYDYTVTQVKKGNNNQKKKPTSGDWNMGHFLILRLSLAQICKVWCFPKKIKSKTNWKLLSVTEVFQVKARCPWLVLKHLTKNGISMSTQDTK